MNGQNPTLSIGIPVYNGGRYLESTLQSIIVQTFVDFEVIVSDNASTDATAEICHRYAGIDQRIRYFRNSTNLGAARNYNRVFELSTGKYFKWNGHDDPLSPNFLEHCVSALDRDDTIILAYGAARAINEYGHSVKAGPLAGARLKHRSGLASHDPCVRFFTCVAKPAGHPVGPIFGVIRRDVLLRTPLLGAYISHDLPLIAEMVLHGRFMQLPAIVQYRRYHPEQGYAKHTTRNARESWFDPARVNRRTFPRIRLLQEHFKAIGRAAQGTRSRVCCYVGTIVWFLTEVVIIRPAKLIGRAPYLYFRSRLLAPRESVRSD